MRRPGDFQAARRRHQARQRLFAAIARVRAGEDNVEAEVLAWGEVCRVVLTSVDQLRDYDDLVLAKHRSGVLLASCEGSGTIFNYIGERYPAGAHQERRRGDRRLVLAVVRRLETPGRRMRWAEAACREKQWDERAREARRRSTWRHSVSTFGD